MKTTINVDDDLLLEAKRRAAQAGMTLRAYIEEALRARMLAKPLQSPRFRLSLPIVTGASQPAVDVADRRSLYDFMENRD